MSRFSNKKILLFYLLLLVLIALLMPAGTDWSRTYRAGDSKPLGLEVFSLILDDYFENDLLRNEMPPAEILQEFTDSSAYIIVTEYFDPGPRSLEVFLEYVRNGNELFISAMHISRAFSDSIGLGIVRYMSFPLSGSFIEQDSMEVQLLFDAPSGRKYSAEIHQGLSQAYLRYDSLTYERKKLGEVAGQDDNFAAIKLGEGMIYLHSTPDLFSNYALLYEECGEYVAACLSLLRAGDIILDQYFLPGKRAGSSPLRVILADPSLKWLYYLTIAGLILYAIFGIKRRSRPVPVIERRENQSIQFATTVAGLYYKKASYKELAMLRFNALKEYMHNHYQLEDLTTSEESAVRLAEQTAYSKEKLGRIFKLLNENMYDSRQFLEFTRRVNQFYQYLNRYKNV